MAGVLIEHRNRKRKLLIASAKRKSNYTALSQVAQLPPGSPEDRYRLWRRCHLDLLLTKAKGMAIKYDMRQFAQDPQQFTFLNHQHMENINEKIAAYESQVLALQNKIEMLETIPPSTGNEAHYLRELIREKDNELLHLRARVKELEAGEKISYSHHDIITDENNDADAIHSLQQENHNLQQQLASRAYMDDLIEENKQHIIFLQNQLEQRIKTSKTLEQQLEVITAEERKKADQLILAENNWKENLQQIQMLEASSGDLQDEVNNLKSRVEELQDKNTSQQNKINHYKSLFHRLFAELEAVNENQQDEAFVETI